MVNKLVDFSWPNHPKLNAEASLARWSGPPASMELTFLDPDHGARNGQTEKSGERFQFFDVGSYCIWIVAPKTIWQNSWTSYWSFLRNLLITSQRWHVPKEMNTRKITKESYFAQWIMETQKNLIRCKRVATHRCDPHQLKGSFDVIFPLSLSRTVADIPKQTPKRGQVRGGVISPRGRNADSSKSWLKTLLFCTLI